MDWSRLLAASAASATSAAKINTKQLKRKEPLFRPYVMRVEEITKGSQQKKSKGERKKMERLERMVCGHCNRCRSDQLIRFWNDKELAKNAPVRPTVNVPETNQSTKDLPRRSLYVGMDLNWRTIEWIKHSVGSSSSALQLEFRNAVVGERNGKDAYVESCPFNCTSCRPLSPQEVRKSQAKGDIIEKVPTVTIDRLLADILEYPGTLPVRKHQHVYRSSGGPIRSLSLKPAELAGLWKDPRWMAQDLSTAPVVDILWIDSHAQTFQALRGAMRTLTHQWARVVIFKYRAIQEVTEESPPTRVPLNTYLELMHGHNYTCGLWTRRALFPVPSNCHHPLLETEGISVACVGTGRGDPWEIMFRYVRLSAEGARKLYKKFLIFHPFGPLELD